MGQIVYFALRAILFGCIIASLPSFGGARAQDDAPGEVTRLIEQISGGEFNKRQSAAMDEVLRHPETQTFAVLALIELLQGDDRDVGKSAAEALGVIGAAANPAVPALEEIISAETGGPLRRAAIFARTKIAAAQERARYQVRFEDDLLSVKADDAGLNAVLKEISGQAKIAVVLGEGVGERRISGEVAELSLSEGLRLLLADYDLFTYHRGGRGLLTIWVYGKMEGRGLYPIPPEMWASTADLEKQLDDYDPDARISALENIVDRNAAEAGRFLIQALDDGDDRVRTTALSMALDDEIEVPAERLSDLAASDPSHNVRFLALKKLLGDPNEEWAAEEALEVALSDANPLIRGFAERALNRLYPLEEPEGAGQQSQQSSQ